MNCLWSNRSYLYLSSIILDVFHRLLLFERYFTISLPVSQDRAETGNFQGPNTDNRYFSIWRSSAELSLISKRPRYAPIVFRYLSFGTNPIACF